MPAQLFPVWDLPREGRAWSEEELRYFFAKGPEKSEIIEGRLFWTEEDRINVLALLIINVGIDKVVRLGSSAVWQEAILNTLQDQSHTP